MKITPANPGKLILIMAVLIGLVIGLVYLLRDFETTPSGCLYYVGKAIHTHDADMFFTYVDLQRVLSRFKPGAPRSGGLAARLAFSAMDNLNKNAYEYIRKIIEDNKRPNLPGSFALLLSAQQGLEQDGQMQVMLPSLSFDSRPIRFMLARYPRENIWKVVEINHHDLEWLFLGYLGVNVLLD